jgi:hypothetical protein
MLHSAAQRPFLVAGARHRIFQDFLRGNKKKLPENFLTDGYETKLVEKLLNKT